MSNEVELSEETQKIVEATKKNATVSGNVINLDPEHSLHKEMLPDGLTAEMVRNSQRYIQKLVAGSVAAAGDIALEMFKEDKDLSQVTVEPVRLFNDSVFFTIKRETIKHNPKTGERIVKHGFVDSTYRARATRSSGEMGKVKQKLHSLYEEVLGG